MVGWYLSFVVPIRMTSCARLCPCKARCKIKIKWTQNVGKPTNHTMSKGAGALVRLSSRLLDTTSFFFLSLGIAPREDSPALILSQSTLLRPRCSTFTNTYCNRAAESFSCRQSTKNIQSHLSLSKLQLFLKFVVQHLDKVGYMAGSCRSCPVLKNYQSLETLYQT